MVSEISSAALSPSLSTALKIPAVVLNLKIFVHTDFAFLSTKALLNIFSDTNILISVFSSYLLFFTQNCATWY